MASGIFFLVLTGVIWVGVGAVINGSGRKGLSLDFIQGMQGLIIMLIGLPFYFLGDSLPHPLSLGVLFFAGIVNYFVFLIARKAMSSGPSGLTWTIMQSSFVMPFLMGVFFFGVPCSPLRIAGILLLFTSMFVMGLGANIKDEGNSDAKKKKMVWIFFTLLAFSTAGFCQCCFNLPSYFIKEDAGGIDSLLFRSGVNAAGAVAIFLASPLWNKRSFEYKNCLSSVILLTVCALVSTCCLFLGLDRMAACGAGAIGYPITMGTSIVAFLFYTSFRLKEKLSWTALCGVALSLSGIVLLTF